MHALKQDLGCYAFGTGHTQWSRASFAQLIISSIIIALQQHLRKYKYCPQLRWFGLKYFNFTRVQKWFSKIYSSYGICCSVLWPRRAMPSHSSQSTMQFETLHFSELCHWYFLDVVFVGFFAPVCLYKTTLISVYEIFHTLFHKLFALDYFSPL